MPIEKKALTQSIQLFDLNDFSNEESVTADFGPFAVNSNGDIFTYYDALKKMNSQGNEQSSIVDKKCPDIFAFELVSVPNTNLVVSGHPIGREPDDFDAYSYLRIWDVKNGKCVDTIDMGWGWLGIITSSPDGRYLGYSAIKNKNKKDAYMREGLTWLYDLKSRKVQCIFSGYHPEFATDGGYFVFDNITNTVIQYSIDSCKPKSELSVDTFFYDFAINNYANLLVGGGDSVELWDMESGKKIKTLDQDKGIGPTIVGFSPDGRFLVTTSNSASIDQKDKIYLWGVLER
jgi:WD40 repeat protein